MSQSLSSLQKSVPSDIRQLLMHQLQSWQQGTRPLIETIVMKARPEHRTVAAFALIKQEIVLREQAGEAPQLNEYVTRFPECADSLSREGDSEDATMMNPKTGYIDVRPENDRPLAELDKDHSHLGRDTEELSFANTYAEIDLQPLSGLFKMDSESGTGIKTPGTAPTADKGVERPDPFAKMIGLYRLDKKLGQGGMGAVFKAVHTKLDKIVAIKVMSRHGSLDDTAVERFEREMRAVGRIEHPNVIRAMDAGEADGFHFLVMEYVEGQDVSQLVKAKGPFPIGQACEIIRQASLGLNEAHALGLVHRDIKPSNLFLTNKGIVKILDLGLARLSQGAANNLELTQSGLCMGTPDYMAPEQWVNAREVDGRSDFYALGCTLFHLIVGHPPFGTKEHMSLGNKVLAHTSGIIPDVRLLCENFPEGLKPVLDRMLAKDRDKRYANGIEMAAALQPFCSPLPGADFASVSQILVSPLRGNISGPPGQRRWIGTLAAWGGGIAMMAIASFIIVRITDPHGRVTEVKVPAGSSVTVSHVTEEEAKPALSKTLVQNEKRANRGSSPATEAATRLVAQKTITEKTIAPETGTDKSPSPKDPAAKELVAKANPELTSPGAQSIQPSVPGKQMSGPGAPAKPQPSEDAPSGNAPASTAIASASGKTGDLGKAAGGSTNPKSPQAAGPSPESATASTGTPAEPGESVKPSESAKPAETAKTSETAKPGSETPLEPAKMVGKPMPSGTVVAVNTTPEDPVPAKIVQAVSLRLPVSATTLAEQQAAWSRELNLVTTKLNSLGMPFVLIPPGEFEMGYNPQNGAAQSGPDEAGGQGKESSLIHASEMPQHRVKISRPFAMGQHEVTVGQFRQFVVATQYKTLAERETATGNSLSMGINQKNPARLINYSWQFAGDMPIEDDHPVVNISWYDAVAFSEWLSQKEGVNYRLPTEAEWEYAVQAGMGTSAKDSQTAREMVKDEANISDASSVREFGNSGVFLKGVTAQWDDRFAILAPVGQFAPNALGIHDLMGNVAEWCSDRFGAEFYKVSPLENPRGPSSGNFRVVRGASWQSPVADCRPEIRSFAGPGQSQLNVGFRLVQELPSPEAAKLPKTGALRELAIAEWVLQAGGKVRVSINGAAANETSKLSDLPRIATGTTYSLHSVSLAETGICDLGLVRLKPLTNLQELDLSGNPISDAGLAEVVGHRSLKKLTLRQTHVTGAGLVQFGKNSKLTDLDLSYCPVTDNSISPVSSLVTLNVLKLDSTAVSDTTLELLKPLTALKELSLADTRVTGSGLVHLKRIPGLTSLDLSQTPLVNKSLHGLSELRALRQLRLNWSSISFIGLDQIKDTYSLLEIGLRGTETGDSNIDVLEKLKAIKKLDLRETDFSDSGVGLLKKALNKAEINASIGYIDARVASLCLSVGGKVVIATDSRSATREITDLKNLPSGNYVLREIDLSNLPVSNGVLLLMPKLKNLSVLNLSGTRIDDAGLAGLAAISRLDTLNLNGTMITDQGLSHLTAIKNLKTLTVRETRVPEDKVTQLQKLLPNVQVLTLAQPFSAGR